MQRVGAQLDASFIFDISAHGGTQECVTCSHVYMSHEQSRHVESLSTTPVQGTCTRLSTCLPPAFTAALTDTGMVCMLSQQQQLTSTPHLELTSCSENCTDAGGYIRLQACHKLL